MESIERAVFISYRRKDSYQALAVYQYLTGQQYDVFLDYRSIPSGDFEQIIVSNIKARAHFILILTPTALDRCNEPGDWLRREIETAIDEKRNIVPLFFDDFHFSSPRVAEKLTGKLAALRRYNGLEIPPGYFTEAMERLREKYLNVPLDAVIHPVPPDVQVLVKEQQVATDQALRDKRVELDKFVKPAREISESLKPIFPSTSTGEMGRDGGTGRNWRLYGIGAGILAVLALGIAGINSLMRDQNNPIVVPTQDSTTELTSPSVSPTAATTSPLVTAVSAPDLENMKTSEVDGMVLLYVQAGEFQMGSETGDIDEIPVHTVFLDAFWIDQTEVTNSMYARCVKDQQCHPPPRTYSNQEPYYYGNPAFDHYPVIHVSWDDADAYCAWAERRLPTEAEWEKAARGTDGRPYPWGAPDPNDQILNYNHSDEGDTTAVGSYPDGASPYGALDMAGNVWEWVADRYSDTYYARSPGSNPSGPTEGEHRVLRGGGWQQGPRDVRAANRHNLLASDTTRGIGFRCAYSP